MSMADNIESFRKLLDWIDEQVKLPGNKTLQDEILQRYSGIIDPYYDIYELCIEKIISKQANDFYNDFPLTDIKDQLIADFMKMEHFKRRDNFDDFCMAIYQQIEAITNKLSCLPDVDSCCRKLYGSKAFIDDHGSRTGTYSIAKFLFGSIQMKTKSEKPIKEMLAMDKYYVILFFICYNGRLRNASIDYEEYRMLKSGVSDIYRVRNRNHRGDPTPEEKILYDKILGNTHINYFKYTWILCCFVSKIKDGYNHFADLKKEADASIGQEIELAEPIVLGKMDVSQYGKRFKK